MACRLLEWLIVLIILISFFLIILSMLRLFRFLSVNLLHNILILLLISLHYSLEVIIRWVTNFILKVFFLNSLKQIHLRMNLLEFRLLLIIFLILWSSILILLEIWYLWLFACVNFLIEGTFRHIIDICVAYNCWYVVCLSINSSPICVNLVIIVLDLWTEWLHKL